jgi:hypothetical protein
MPQNEGSEADLAAAMAQLDSMPPPSPPVDVADQPMQKSADREAWREYSGEPQDVHSVHSAARFLATERKKRGQEPDGSTPEPIVAVRYQDGRPPDQEVSAQEAARDLSAYRRETAQQLLEEITGQATAPQPEPAAPMPEPEPPPQYSQAELEQAAMRQQTAESWQHAATTAQNYDVLLQAQLQSMLGVGQQEFADVKQLADQIGEQAAVAQLAQKDPARFARFQDADQKFRAAQVELGRIRQTQQEQYAANYRQYGEREDAAAEKAIPELGPTADPRARQAIQQATRDTLLDAGFTNEELLQNWTHGNSAVMLRDHRVQRVIADAARWRLSQAKLKEALKQPYPAVQRPGVRQSQGSYSDQTIASHDRALSSSGNIRDAVALRRAVYAQRRQGQ